VLARVAEALILADHDLRVVFRAQRLAGCQERLDLRRRISATEAATSVAIHPAQELPHEVDRNDAQRLEQLLRNGVDEHACLRSFQLLKLGRHCLERDQERNRKRIFVCVLDALAGVIDQRFKQAYWREVRGAFLCECFLYCHDVDSFCVVTG